MNLPEYLNINGTNYATDRLTEAAKMQIANIQVVDGEIARLNQQLAIAQTARAAYAAALIEAVKVKDEVPGEKVKKPRASRKPKAAQE